jgi:hypothetical protein
MRPSLAGLAALALWLLSASTAAAWTRTTVESVRAHLDVDGRGAALVLLEVDLRVRGGWLSHFELAELGEGVVLDADKPPWLVGEDGRKYVPDARVRSDGRVEISFPRRSRAPWRGRYTLGVLYHVPLQADPEAGTVRWTLPAWHVDLQNVVVKIEGAAGLELIDAGAENVDVHERTTGRRGQLKLTRAQLPRTLGWELEVAVPGSGPGSAQGQTPDATRSGAPFSGAHLLACVVLAVLAWLKRGLARLEARARGAVALPLLPLGRPELAAALILGTGIAAGWLHASHPQPALGLLILTAAMGLTRGARRAAMRPGTTRRAVAALDVQRARRQRLHTLLGPRAWLDATTPPGALLLLTSGGLVLLWTRAQVDPIWLECWLAALPLYLNATRWQMPRSDGETLLQLGRLQEPLRRVLRAHDGRLDVEVDASGAQPQLVVRLAAPVEGLRGLRLAQGFGQGHGRGALVWCAVCEVGSTAEARLARAMPHARRQRSADGRWAARSVATRDAPAELAALLDWLDAARAPATDAAAVVRSAA